MTLSLGIFVLCGASAVIVLIFEKLLISGISSRLPRVVVQTQRRASPEMSGFYIFSAGVVVPWVPRLWTNKDK